MQVVRESRCNSCSALIIMAHFQWLLENHKPNECSYWSCLFFRVEGAMPRRIVLLSDGTGNSSASFWRTNVWRMFAALDLTSNDQVACYDDGVGTSSFQPLAILGGAFGIGLRRNVISLYKFACRNFRQADDEIYAFGFSRGAFTIRVLIGLIVDQGLIPADSIS